VLANQRPEMIAVAVGVDRFDSRRDLTVAPALEAVIVGHSTDVVAVERRHQFAPLRHETLQQHAARLHQRLEIKVVIERHDGAHRRLVGHGGQLCRVAVVGDADGADPAIGPGLARRPGGHLAKVGHLVGGELHRPPPSRGTAAARVHLEHDEATSIEVVPLGIDELGGAPQMQRGEQAYGPSELRRAPVARRSHERRATLARPVAGGQPDVDGDLDAVAHRDIDGGVAPRASSGSFLSGNAAGACGGRRGHHQRQDVGHQIPAAHSPLLASCWLREDLEHRAGDLGEALAEGGQALAARHEAEP
jgi:hypothetical protein